MKKTLLASTIVAALGGLLFGFDTAVISGTTDWLVAKGRVDEASSVFDACGTDSGNVDEEIRDIQASLDVQHHSLEEPFVSKK